VWPFLVKRKSVAVSGKKKKCGRFWRKEKVWPYLVKRQSDELFFSVENSCMTPLNALKCTEHS
jgi:hypothetical protein